MTTTNFLQNTKTSRLAKQFINDINSGCYTPGSPLPQQEDLAKKYQVSCPTLRKVLNVLTSEGKLVKTPQGGIVLPAAKEDTTHGAWDLKTINPRIKPAIAAVWAAEPDTHHVEIRKGISQYAAEAGLDFKVFLSAGGHEKALDALRHIEECQVQGVIVLPYNHPDYISTLNHLVAKQYPLVCVDRQVAGVEASSVEVDNAAGVYESTHYLIEKYLRPVYFVSSPLDHSTIANRYQGYRRAMADTGFDAQIDAYTFLSTVSDQDPAYWPIEQKPHSADVATDRLLDQATFPISVQCMNDYIARSFYQAAQRRGLVVGRDIMVAGFDDIPMAKFLKPSLTTLRQPRIQIGREAAKLLHQIITKKVSKPVHIHLPVELIARESA